MLKARKKTIWSPKYIKQNENIKEYPVDKNGNKIEKINNMWPENIIEEIKIYHEEGLTDKQIADKIGTTKNSILGIRHRRKIGINKENAYISSTKKIGKKIQKRAKEYAENNQEKEHPGAEINININKIDDKLEKMNNMKKLRKNLIYK